MRFIKSTGKMNFKKNLSYDHASLLQTANIICMKIVEKQNLERHVKWASDVVIIILTYPKCIQRL